MPPTTPTRLKLNRVKQCDLASLLAGYSRVCSQFQRLPFVSFQLRRVQFNLHIRIECVLSLTFRPALFLLTVKSSTCCLCGSVELCDGEFSQFFPSKAFIKFDAIQM